MLRSLSTAVPFLKTLTSKDIVEQLSLQRRSERKTTPKLKTENSELIDVIKPYYYLSHQRPQLIKTQKQFRHLSDVQKHHYLHRKNLENRTRLRKISRNFSTQVITEAATCRGWKDKYDCGQFLPPIGLQNIRTEASQTSGTLKKGILRNSYNNLNVDTERKRLTDKRNSSIVNHNDIKSLVNMVRAVARKLTNLNHKKQSKNLKLVMNRLSMKVSSSQPQKTVKYADKSFSPKAWESNSRDETINQIKEVDKALDEELDFNFPKTNKEDIGMKISKIMTDDPYKQIFLKRVSKLNVSNTNELTTQHRFNKSIVNNLKQADHKYHEDDSKSNHRLSNTNRKSKNDILKDKQNTKQRSSLVPKIDIRNETLEEQSFQSSLKSQSLLSSQSYIQTNIEPIQTKLNGKTHQENRKSKLKKSNQQQQQPSQKQIKTQKQISKRQSSLNSQQKKSSKSYKLKSSSIRKSRISQIQFHKRVSQKKIKTSLIAEVKIDEILEFETSEAKINENDLKSGSKRASHKRVTSLGKASSEKLKHKQRHMKSDTDELHQNSNSEGREDSEEETNFSHLPTISSRKNRKLKLGEGFIDAKGVNMIKQELQTLKAKPKIRRVGKLVNVQKLQPTEIKPIMKPEQIMRDFVFNLKKKRKTNKFSYDNVIPTDRLTSLPLEAVVESWSLITAKRQIINLFSQFQNSASLEQLHSELLSNFGKLEKARQLSMFQKIPQYFQMNTIFMSYDNIYDNLFEKHQKIAEPNLNIAKKYNFIIDFYYQNQIAKLNIEEDNEDSDYIPYDIWQFYRREKQQTSTKRNEDDLGQFDLTQEGRFSVFDIKCKAK